MAHNSNSHDALWLPNSQTELFSVYAGNAQSSCLVVGALANCSTHAGLPHWSFDRRNCCVSVGRSMSWRQLNAEDGDQCLLRVGRCQPGMQVSDPLATGAPDMQPCSQLVDEQEAMTQHRRDVIASTSPGYQTCVGVLDRLDLPKKAVRHTIQQRVAIVETDANESLDRCSGGGGGHWLNSWT